MGSQIKRALIQIQMFDPMISFGEKGSPLKGLA